MSCVEVEIYDCSDSKRVRLNCKKPDYLKQGDKVALISPSFFTPMEVRRDGASLRFDIDGAQHTVPAASNAAPASPLSERLLLSGKRAL